MPGKLEKPQTASVIPSTPSRKRDLDTDGVADDLAPPAKRAKSSTNANDKLFSPSKKRKLEEDGLLMLDNPNEKIDDADGGAEVVDTITIDDD